MATRSKKGVGSKANWIEEASRVCLAAARGDLEQRLLNLPSSGPEAVLMNSINHLLDMTDAFVRESRAALWHASHGKFYRRVMLRGMRGTFQAASRDINSAIAQMAASRAERQAIEDEKARMAAEFTTTLGEVIASVSDSATQVQSAAGLLSTSAQDSALRAAALAAASEETSTTLGNMAAASEELACSIGEVADKANASANATRDAQRESARTQELVADLAESSRQVEGMLGLVTRIASQTNLLSLNATIEAARAGEAGRGFAVVASEVKDLARQTARATEEIEARVSAILRSTGEASDAMCGIGVTIGQICEFSEGIATAVEQQRFATREISVSVNQAAAGTQEGATSVMALSSLNGELSELAGQLLNSSETLVELVQRLRSLQGAAAGD